jgi:tetratricopeptide (TPR) repeat protein
MKLVSVTIANNRENVIADMVGSVSRLVDEVIILDTGITDNTLLVAAAVCAETDTPFKVVDWPWHNDFSAARNAELDAAKDAGADFALMLDTDEVLELGEGEDIRKLCETLPAHHGHISLPDSDRVYIQPRIFRIPAWGSFSGRTHEAYSPSMPCTLLEKTCFRGAPKTQEQLAEKLARDEAILRDVVAAEPDSSRWNFYLGNTLRGQGKWLEAIEWYEKCSDLRSGWREEPAWACFNAADCWIRLGQFQRAIDMCAEGLARHAGIAELAWLASYAASKAGQNDQAVYWGRISVALGKFKGIGSEVPRIGFKNGVGLWEGPYDVMRFAYKELGEMRDAQAMEIAFQIAKKYRESRKE